MKILKKIIEAIVPVSRRDIAEIVNVLDGLTVANGQQAEMLANLINQVSGLQMVKAEKEEQKDKKIEYDEAFQ